MWVGVSADLVTLEEGYPAWVHVALSHLKTLGCLLHMVHIPDPFSKNMVGYFKPNL